MITKRLLVAFSDFYDNSDSQKRTLMFAIIHWLLLGQTYDLAWERFEAQYKVLDALYKISGINSKTHASRPVELAKKYKIKLPDWAKIIRKESRLSKIRNELIHEAKYAGRPIGYAYPEDNFDLELVAFNVKLVIKIAGLDTPYLKADISNRMLYLWDFST